MKEISRQIYLNKLIARKENGLIKVITGIRRSGKSYLLFRLYYNYLRSIGVSDENIVCIQLDNEDFEELRDKKELSKYIKLRTQGEGTHYVFIDEIQFCDGFEGVLNGLLYRENVDVYVTGSNSKSLSTDVLTEFRGRGDEVRVFPLSFSEYMQAFDGDKYDGWRNYITYGGLPLILSRTTPESKAQYLSDLFKRIYLRDIVERNGVRGEDALGDLCNVLASSIGSPSNPNKLANTFLSSGRRISAPTVSTYIGFFENAFLIKSADKYDVKGKKYISTSKKYYFTDVGLRNARLNFRQVEDNHIMENVIFNELIMRGYNVDVGAVDVNENVNGVRKQKQLEIDFVCNLGSKRYYIQSALTVSLEEKMRQEERSLLKTDDNFKKIIITSDNILGGYNEKGIYILNLFDFLLNPDSLEG